ASSGALGPVLDVAGPQPTNTRFGDAIEADRSGRFWVVNDAFLDSDTTNPFEDVAIEARRMSADGATLTPVATLARLGGVPTSSCAGGLGTDAGGAPVPELAVPGAGSAP